MLLSAHKQAKTSVGARPLSVSLPDSVNTYSVNKHLFRPLLCVCCCRYLGNGIMALTYRLVTLGTRQLAVLLHFPNISIIGKLSQH